MSSSPSSRTRLRALSCVRVDVFIGMFTNVFTHIVHVGVVFMLVLVAPGARNPLWILDKTCCS